ncbi:MAG: hypothetical protein GY796_21750 [Chloroflexi bacterium]|nr:hypothetical protein [Chloroflexota bacterium]
MAESEQTTTDEMVKDGKPTPELVRKVVEKVYALWQRDLAIEFERQRRFKGR